MSKKYKFLQFFTTFWQFFTKKRTFLRLFYKFFTPTCAYDRAKAWLSYLNTPASPKSQPEANDYSLIANDYSPPYARFLHIFEQKRQVLSYFMQVWDHFKKFTTPLPALSAATPAIYYPIYRNNLHNPLQINTLSCPSFRLITLNRKILSKNLTNCPITGYLHPNYNKNKPYHPFDNYIISLQIYTSNTHNLVSWIGL